MRRTPYVCDRCGADLETPYHMSFWSTVGELNIKGAAEKDLCEGCAREVAAYAEAKIRPLARGEAGHTPATEMHKTVIAPYIPEESEKTVLPTVVSKTPDPAQKVQKSECEAPEAEQKVPKASGHSTKQRDDVNEEAIARLMAEGKDQKEIASVLNCSRTTVQRRVLRMKEQQQTQTEKQPERTEPDRPAGKVMKRKEIDIEQLKELYNSGATYGAIAMALGVSAQTVQNRITELTAARKLQPRQQDIDSGKVIALKKAGWDAAKIASECRTEAWMINNILFSAEEKGVDLSPNDTKNRALEWNDNNDETCMTMGNVVSGTTVLNQWAEY